MKWETVEDNYWKEGRYVGPGGCIVGVIRRLRFGPHLGLVRAYAYREEGLLEEGLLLGDFETVSQAKRAVKAYWAERRKAEQEAK